MVYSTEKSLAEHGDKLDVKDKEAIEKSIGDLKDILKDENADGSEIKAKLEALNSAAMKLGEIMYKQNPQDNQKTGAEQAEKGSENKKEKGTEDENVVDADFEEVDEDTEKKSS